MSELSKADKIVSILVGKSIKDAKDLIIQANLRLQVVTPDEPCMALFQPDLIKVVVENGKVIQAWVG